MNYLNRAYTSNLRNTSRTIILFLLIFLLGIFLSIAISIRIAMINTDLNLRNKFPAVTTLSWNYDEAKNSNKITHEKNLTIDVVEEIYKSVTEISKAVTEISQLPFVKAYDYTLNTSLYSQDLEWVKNSIDDVLLPESLTPDDVVDLQSSMRDRGGEVEVFDIVGINNPNPIDMQTGLISLVSGRFITQEELNNSDPVAVISKEMAIANHLMVGSTLTLTNNVYDQLKIEEEHPYTLPELFWHLDGYILASQSLEFEIIGLFDVDPNIYFPDDNGAWSIVDGLVRQYNQIYIPINISEEIFDFKIQNNFTYFIKKLDWDNGIKIEDLLPISSIFLLNNSQDFEAFSLAAADILPEFWEVKDLSANIGTFTRAMDNVLWIADLILWGTATATIIILSSLIMLFLRDRKYEIGIYMSLGEKKRKIISQILFEVFSISTVAMILALFFGIAISNAISRQLLEQDLIHQEQIDFGTLELEYIPKELILFNTGVMTTDEILNNHAISLEGTAIFTYFSIGLGSILISTVMPILYIIRLEPKKVLL